MVFLPCCGLDVHSVVPPDRCSLGFYHQFGDRTHAVDLITTAGFGAAWRTTYCRAAVAALSSLCRPLGSRPPAD